MSVDPEHRLVEAKLSGSLGQPRCLRAALIDLTKNFFDTAGLCATYGSPT